LFQYCSLCWIFCHVPTTMCLVWFYSKSLWIVDLENWVLLSRKGRPILPFFCIGNFDGCFFLGVTCRRN
jgi:hypothetical protein